MMEGKFYCRFKNHYRLVRVELNQKNLLIYKDGKNSVKYFECDHSTLQDFHYSF